MQGDEEEREYAENEQQEEVNEQNSNTPPIESILTNNEAKMELLHNGEANRRYTLAQADRHVSDMFKTKTQTLLWVMNEIRQALSVTNKPEQLFGNDEDNKDAEYIFDDETSRKRLKEQYGKVLDAAVRYVTQIDPINEKK